MIKKSKLEALSRQRWHKKPKPPSEGGPPAPGVDWSYNRNDWRDSKTKKIKKKGR
jgi:hypothetical protein